MLSIAQPKMPNLCARCGAIGPHPGSWTVTDSEGVFGGTMRYRVEVPVCSACKSTLERNLRHCWLFALCAGILGGMLTTSIVYYFWTDWAITRLFLIPIAGTAGCGILGFSFAHDQWVRLANVSEGGKKITFRNERFQHAFDFKNYSSGKF